MKKSNVAALVATAVMIAAVLWLLDTRNINASFEEGLQKERLKSESLLSEKLLVEKDLEKIKEQMSSLRGKNAELDKVILETEARLKRQEADYSRMKRENQSLALVKKQRQELQLIQRQLESELAMLRTSYAELESKNAELNNAIVSLEDRNRMLSDDLNRALLASIDQGQVQAVRGKSERLTVRARRTQKLIANFEVPGNLKQLSFRIIQPDGNTLNKEHGTTAFTTSPSDENLTASTGKTTHASKMQRVQIVYIANEKLKSGTYTVEILNENLYVGSLRVKLR